jgi:Carboxyltransferase domain, subdomain C and D
MAAHLQGDYSVYRYGFAPGYAYLGGAPEPIQLPRKSAAVRDVAAGSVLITGPQCLVTTLTMLSGWWNIGHSPTQNCDDGRGSPLPLQCWGPRPVPSHRSPPVRRPDEGMTDGPGPFCRQERATLGHGSRIVAGEVSCASAFPCQARWTATPLRSRTLLLVTTAQARRSKRRWGDLLSNA